MSELNYNIHPNPVGKWSIRNNTTSMVSFIEYNDGEFTQTINVDTVDLEDLLKLVTGMKDK